MENLLLKKLQIKPGFTVCVINAPENFESIFGTLPSEVSFSFGLTENYHALLIFAITKAEMIQALDATCQQINKQAITWIMYPKAKTKLAGDLNLMQSWDELKSYQLTPCASAAIDAIWTALRIKPVDAQKKSGLGNAEIKTNDYGEFIDVQQKIVTLPPDVKAELSKQPQALVNFDKLAYSHKKEYVLWILSAKQEKTRLTRLEKMVEMLLNGKKNPSEKG